MSLNASNFVVKGPIRSLDLKQFVDLFTGVMTDQPVTFKNAMVVGGNQGASTAPLKLVGVTGQAGNLIELYPTTGAPTPTFGFGALGNFAWGPATPGANDTFLSRVAQQNGHVTDTAGLLVEPYLEVKGLVRADGWTFTNGATITSPTDQPFSLIVNRTLGFTNINDRMHVMGVGVGLAMESLDGYAGVFGAVGSLVGVNITYDGAHWTRINPAVGVAHLNLSSGGMSFYTAPAAAGQDPPWVAAFTVDSAGTTTVTGGVSATTFTARARTIYLPDGNAYITTDTNNNIFIRGVATYIQTNTGAMAPLATGDITANNVTIHASLFNYGSNNNGVIYFESSNAVYIAWRPDLSALYIPYGNGIYTTRALLSRIDWEASRAVYFNWDGSNVTMNMAGPWGFAAPVLKTGATLYFGTDNLVYLTRGDLGGSPPTYEIRGSPRTHLHMNSDVVIDAPSIVNLGPQPGGAIVSPGTNIGKSADTVYLSAHAYVFFDLGVGHVITCQQLIQTSDPNLKNSATLFDDASCMARVRGNVPVYTYQLDPPSGGSSEDGPHPTPNNIGMMAPDVYATSPEFTALDDQGQPVGVNYASMASLLWGALRQLDARCTAKGI